jgi:hypothetical protein
MLNQLLQLLVTGFFYGTISAIFAMLISPLQFLKIIRQQTGKKYTKIFYDTINRSGFFTFFRGAIPYATMNFFSSMAFGVSEYLSEYVIKVALLPLVIAIIVRATLGGFIETMFSSYSELKEITKNKGSLIKTKPRLVTIIIPILLRNIIFWYGSVISYEISIKYDLGVMLSVVIAFCLGVIFAICSIAFDVIATQNCGDIENKGVIRRFKEILEGGNSSAIFAGTLMRIIQIGIFTITTVLTMFLFDYITPSSNL